MLRFLRSFIDSGAILTQDARKQMLENGRLRQRLSVAGPDAQGFLPVVKLFTPDANCIWLLTELDPDDPDIAFGLCDLGMGFPELGQVLISEIEAVRGSKRLPVEHDARFAPTHPLSVYARAAQTAGAITESPHALAEAAAAMRDEH